MVLYVILPYFNYCNFKKRRTLFIDFVHRIKYARVRVVVVECGRDLPLFLPVWKHYRLRETSPVWIKENLINYGVSKLPADWQFMAWIDADLTFLSPTWVQDTIKALGSSDVVQMFQTAVNMGPTGEAFKIDKAFAHMYLSGSPYHRTDKYGHWHPGYAWAITKPAYQKIGGLLSWAILGSGDRHLAMALIGRVHDSYHQGVHNNYKSLLDDFQKRCKGLTLGCVPGSILHHWHGSLDNRKYRERWLILVDNKYDPLMDVGLDKHGVIHLTLEGMRLEVPLIRYFMDRLEDA
jgi:hypothetical protein